MKAVMTMNISLLPKYEVLRLGPWILYMPDEMTYLFVLNEDIETDHEGDNFICLTGVNTIGQAVKVFMEAMEEA